MTLPQVVDICMGQSPPGKSYNEEGVGLPFFQGKADFTDYHPAVRVYCTEPKKIVNPGDILISVRAPVGPTNVADRVCAIGRGLAGLAPLAEIPTNYILFSLRYKEPEIGLWGTGTTFKAINKSHLESIELPLPPLAEQHRIVAAIEALFTRLDAANARLDRVPGIVKQFRQSVLAAACDGRLTEDWRAEHPSVESASNILNRNAENCRQIWEGEQLRKFQTKGKLPRGGEWKNDYHPSVRPADTPSDELPRSWVWASPDEIKNCNDPYALAIGPFGSNLKVSDYRDEGVPLIFVRNIRSGIFKDENTKYVSETKASELRPHWVSGGDILITKMGDPPGDATLYPIGSPTGIITADCIKLNLFDEIQDASFFVYAFNSESVKKQIFSITMGVAQKKVSLKRFKTIAL
ncbi:MAG: hypothetical protein GX216_08285, partial [Methanomicrobiales archaeon]|nr:hypothetical protein [Methanomicrobiales archaeon]